MGCEIAWIVVRVFISVVITQALHELCGSIAQMQRHGLIAGLLHQRQGIVDSFVCRIALGACGEIYHSLSQRNASLGPTYLHYGIKGGIGKQQGVWIGKSYVFGRDITTRRAMNCGSSPASIIRAIQ